MLDLCFQDVTMRDRGRKVIEGLNIKLSAAKSIALIGAPRTGKTGFLLMAGGYVKPTGGNHLTVVYWKRKFPSHL